MTAFILETGYSPNQKVEVYLNDGEHGVTFNDTSGAGLKYILEHAKVKTVHFRAENGDERLAIFESVERLWRSRRGFSGVKCGWGEIPNGYERVAIKVESGGVESGELE